MRSLPISAYGQKGIGSGPSTTGSTSECRRARDAKRDIPVPLSPCARATTCTCRGRPAPGPRLRHFAPPPDPYDEWLDGVSDALASGLRQLRDLRPLRHFGQPLAPTPTADYPPRASRFPGGQRVFFFVSSVFSVDPLFFSRTTNQHESTPIRIRVHSCFSIRVIRSPQIRVIRSSRFIRVVPGVNP